MDRRYAMRFGLVAALVVGATVVPTPAAGQDAGDLKHGVARISLLNGDVSVKRGDTGDIVAAALNAPLMAEDRVLTGPNSRVEVQFDQANLMRIGGESDVRLSQLENGHYQIDLAQGTLTYRVLRVSTAKVEVDTPTIAIRPSRNGSFRLSVDADGQTEVTARDGDVEVFTASGSQWLHAGTTLLARGSSATSEFRTVSAGSPDAWDNWNESRDRELLAAVSTRYVGPGVYGAEDLDYYGTWSDLEGHGYVWSPNVVSVGWSPYSHGRWAWEDWYNWAWISGDPWGWAPYHYGRWFYQNDHWFWDPSYRDQQYWSPALVGWFGTGGDGIGWVPLAPREHVRRWWGHEYYGRPGAWKQSVNIANVDLTTVYANSRIHNGIMGLSATEIRNGRYQRIDRPGLDQVRNVGLVTGALPLAPSAQSLRFSDRRPAAVAASPDYVRFFRKQTPARVERVPYAEQQRIFERDTASRIPAQVRNSQQPGAKTDGNGARDGWRRFSRNESPAANPRQGESGSGWQRFGTPSGNSTRQPGAEAGSPTEPPAQRNGQSRGWERFGNPSEQRGRQTPAGNQNTQKRPETIRIAPPVTWDRSTPALMQQNAPQMTHQAPSQMQHSQPAPAAPPSRPSGGGGGSAPPPPPAHAPAATK